MMINQIKALFATSSAHHGLPSSATTLIAYNDESQHHIVTVPPFFLSSGQTHDAYPSPLHKVHIMPFLTDVETSNALRIARSFAAENNRWDQQDSSRHASYPTVDFAVDECIELSHYLGASGIGFEERIFGALSLAYDIDANDMSFLDLFCASYESKGSVNELNAPGSDRNTMDHLDFHRDGSLLSFTILLSPRDEFEGGGTTFDALCDIVLNDGETHSILQSPGVIQPPHAGYVVLHSGKLLHGGHTVTKGQRIVLVGFVDVHERNLKPDALGSATKEWGRNDVRLFWNRRRLSLVKQQNKNQPVWTLRSGKYLPKAVGIRRINTSEGRSFFGQCTTLPATILRNIEHRAEEAIIRQRRLATEDKLLREYLLPRNTRVDKIEDSGEFIELCPDETDGLVIGWDQEV